MMNKTSSFINLLISPENIFWAWKKLKKYFVLGDIWYDEYDVSKFESELKTNLTLVANCLRDFNFGDIIIHPLPHPKPEKDGTPQLRQAFSIPVNIQVAWLAFINIIGPELDASMPKWSFGNRLYRNLWYDYNPENGSKVLVHGGYNHSKGQIYKPFHQSWPVFRNTIRLTHRYMIGDISDLSEREEIIDSQTDKLEYLDGGYWDSGGNDRKSLYWLSLDFTKFYQSITKDYIIQGMKQFLSNTLLDAHSEEILKLSDTLLSFVCDANQLSIEECQKVDIPTGINNFTRLPTGLCVAHFLANVAMLPVDLKISQKIAICKNVAHFRYVDDHVALSYRPELLLNWVRDYETLLNEYLPEIKVNYEKTEPLKWKAVFTEPCENWDDKFAELSTSGFNTTEWGFLDYRYPSPLLTQILANVSAIGNLDMDLLDTEEQEHLVDELEALLMSDISEQEIRMTTRMNFAASKLALLAKKIHYFNAYEYELNYNLKKVHDQAYRDEISNSSIKTKTEHERMMSRINKLLLYMLDKNKERLRLWMNVLDFYEKTGRTDYDKIFSLIVNMRSEEENRRSNECNGHEKEYCGGNCSYYISCLNLAIAKKILTSCKTLLLRDIHTCDSIANAETFVKYFIENHASIPKCKKDRFYLIRSRSLLDASIGAAKSILDESLSTSEHINESDQALCWWVGREVGAWNNQSIFEDNSISKILLNCIGDRYAIPKHKKLAGYISMAEWIDLLSKLKESNPFHVLCSEWTALSVLIKVLDCIVAFRTIQIGNIKDIAQTIDISPHNFWFKLPREMSSELRKSSEWTITKWKVLEQFFNKVTIKYHPISSDFRFKPSFVRKMNDEHILLFGLGILLSSLLRHSLDFEPIWTFEGYQYDASLSVKKLMNRTPCSTETSRIIDGCLYDGILSRPYREFTKVKDISSPYSPLRLDSVGQLHKCILLALNVLTKNQSTLSMTKPRQLIPIYEAFGEDWFDFETGERIAIHDNE